MSIILNILRNHLHFVIIVWVLIILMTYPTVVHVFDTHVFWLPTKEFDVWIEFWDAWYGKSLITGQADFHFTDLLFYPQGLSLAHHSFNITHILVFGGLQTIMPASNAYNLTYLLIIFSVTLSAYVYLLYLFNDKWLSLLGAVIFGFSQHVTGHPQHPGISFIATLPLSLYFFHRGILEQRWKWIVLSGILIGLTAFISMYILVCVLLTLGMYILCFAISRWRKRNFWLRIALLLYLIGSISIVRIYPIINNSQALDAALNKSKGKEKANDLLAYFVNYRHPITTPMFYSLFDITPAINVTPSDGTYINGWHHTSYLGYLPLVLIGLGFFGAAYRRKMFPWLMLILPFLLLRLGSVLLINDQEFPDIFWPNHYLDQMFPAIFEVFYQVDHFQMGVLLPLAVLSCYGLMTILKSVPAQCRPWIVLVVAAVIAFEYYYSPYITIMDQRKLAYIQWLDEQENQDSIRLINLPMGRRASKYYGFHQTLTGYPHAEGLARRTPPDAYQYISRNFLLETWRNNRSIQCSLSNQTEYLSALDALADDGFSHIVLHYRLNNAREVSGGFLTVESSYKDKYVSIYSLEDLRNSCPEFIAGHDLVTHYQNLFFSPTIAPRHETILSFHPTERITEEAFRYYSRISQEWRSLIHISHNMQNEVIIQSSRSEFSDLDSIVSDNDFIWLIYNPQQTNLQTMDAYTQWFSRYYKPCKRFLETDNTIVDYHIRVSIPCELIVPQSPLEVLYDNGTQLFNVFHEIDAGQVTFYLWWSNTVRHQYAYSIQIFDEQGGKVQQSDYAIGQELLASHDMDISMLDEGEYAAKFILYDFATQASQSGTVLGNQQRFEREIELARFTISDGL